jgi:hypothetical protein
VDLLMKGLLLATSCHLLGTIAGRRGSRGVPGVFCLVMAALLVMGWIVTLNARGIFDPDFHRFAPLEAARPDWAGTVDRLASFKEMLLVTGLMGALLIAADLFQDRTWRQWLVATVGFTGASVILYGLIQRSLDIREILWVHKIPGNTWPFATYLYHGNAGAFINLVWPWAAAMTVVEFERHSRPFHRAAWAGFFVVCLAGMIVNASKAALIVGLVQGVILGVWALVRLWRQFQFMKLPNILIGILVIGGSIVLVGWSAGWEDSVTRWLRIGSQLTLENPRLQAYQYAIGMLPDAGWMGFGPGTFSHVFPYYTLEAGSRIKGMWRYLHQDYLQTMIEWGKAGAALWFGLYAGGWIAGWWTWQFRGKYLSSGERALVFGSLVALFGTALHALVDFPLQIASLRLYAVVHLGLLFGLLQQTRSRHRRSGREPDAELDASPDPDGLQSRR